MTVRQGRQIDAQGMALCLVSPLVSPLTLVELPKSPSKSAVNFKSLLHILTYSAVHCSGGLICKKSLHFSGLQSPSWLLQSHQMRSATELQQSYVGALPKAPQSDPP